MNKTELIAAVAERTCMTKKDVELVLNATLHSITETMANCEKVQLSGFGIFETKYREARVGRNPVTNEPLQIPASLQPVFKPSKTLKDAVK